MLHTQLDVGWEIAIWIGGLGLAAVFLGIIAFIIGMMSDSDSNLPVAGFMTAICGGIAALICGIITFPPFSMQYHEYKPVSGIVQSVTSRFLSDGSNSTSQRFAVVIGGKIYGCDDTRCSTLRRGSTVTLLCEEEFQLNATPGEVCNWGKEGLNG